MGYEEAYDWFVELREKAVRMIYTFGRSAKQLYDVWCVYMRLLVWNIILSY